MLTLFSVVPDEIYNIYKDKGFYYDDHTYINIFRWLWNDHQFHPDISSFPGDKENKAYITLRVLNKNVKVFHEFANSYDEAIIKIVNHIANNIDTYL